MAEKRMFSKKIIDTDWFMEMPQSAQNLYFHLSMRADDDGFVDSPQRICRMIGSSNDDYRLLIAKSFIIPFENGICVIKDWRINNYLRADRYTPTIHTEEKSKLVIEDSGTYSFGIPNGIPSGIPTGIPSIYTNSNTNTYNNSLSLKEEVNSLNTHNSNRSKKFIKPTIEEIKNYCIYRKNNINAERFFNYYESNGWKVGKNPMKDWKAAVRTWENNNNNGGNVATDSTQPSVPYGDILNSTNI